MCVCITMKSNQKKIFKMSFNNNFLSLENVNQFFNSLIDSNKKNALPLKHIYKLLNDLTNVMNESDYYDVEIKIGNYDDVKIFKAHSHILKTRSLLICQIIG